jgi:hypothetical protein
MIVPRPQRGMVELLSRPRSAAPAVLAGAEINGGIGHARRGDAAEK